MREPSLVGPAFLFMVAGGALIWALNIDERHTIGRGVLVLLAIIAAFYGLLTGLNWVAYQYSARLSEYRRAMAITPELQALSVLSRLRPEQMEFVEKNGIMPLVEIVTGDPDDPDDPGVALFVRTFGGELIPLDFVDRFFDLSRPSLPYLYPTRRFAEGTQDRQNAENLTAHLVLLGMADRARGPHSACLKVPTTQAMKRVGLGVLYQLQEESA